MLKKPNAYLNRKETEKNAGILSTKQVIIVVVCTLIFTIILVLIQMKIIKPTQTIYVYRKDSHIIILDLHKIAVQMQKTGLDAVATLDAFDRVYDGYRQISNLPKRLDAVKVEIFPNMRKPLHRKICAGGV